MNSKQFVGFELIKQRKVWPRLESTPFYRYPEVWLGIALYLAVMLLCILA